MRLIAVSVILAISGAGLVSPAYLFIRALLRARKKVEPGTFDCIFIPAHPLRRNGDVDPEYAERCSVAVRLWRQAPQRIILCCGKRYGATPSPVEIARGHLVERGIPRPYIVVIHDSELGCDTLGELVLLRRVMLSLGLSRPAVASNILHLIQVDVALSRSGVKAVLARSPLRKKNPLYITARLAMPAVAFFDPTGKVFRWLRRGYAKIWSLFF